MGTTSPNGTVKARTVYLTDEAWFALRDEALRERTTASDLLRRLIEEKRTKRERVK